MSTTVTHRCGHTIEHERDYSDYAAAGMALRPCGDCFRAAYAAAVARYSETASALPPLRGSEKQVAWAMKLRGEFLDKHPGYGPLCRYATDCRTWIDGRDGALDFRRYLVLRALEAEDHYAILRAVAREAREIFWRAEEDAAVALQEALYRAFGHQLASLWRMIALISAERDAVVSEIMTPLDDAASDARGSSAERTKLIESIDEIGRMADESLAKEAAAAAARAAEKQRAIEAAVAAARALEERAAQAARELERRWAPYAEIIKAMPGMADDPDGYWTKRKRSMLRELGLSMLEAEPRAAQALRALCAITTRQQLKAIEGIAPTQRLSLVLDAQALAAVVGPSATRAMHVAAGLPKPVIPRKKTEPST